MSKPSKPSKYKPAGSGTSRALPTLPAHANPKVQRLHTIARTDKELAAAFPFPTGGAPSLVPAGEVRPSTFLILALRDAMVLQRDAGVEIYLSTWTNTDYEQEGALRVYDSDAEQELPVCSVCLGGATLVLEYCELGGISPALPKLCDIARVGSGDSLVAWVVVSYPHIPVKTISALPVRWAMELGKLRRAEGLDTLPGTKYTERQRYIGTVTLTPTHPLALQVRALAKVLRGIGL